MYLFPKSYTMVKVIWGHNITLYKELHQNMFLLIINLPYNHTLCEKEYKLLVFFLATCPEFNCKLHLEVFFFKAVGKIIILSLQKYDFLSSFILFSITNI